MPSTKELEDTLPLTVPWHDRYRNPRDKNYQIYTTASLDTTKLQRLEYRMNNAPNSFQQKCRIAAEASHGSLREVYDYHIRVRDEKDDVYALYFLVADSEEWDEKGVLMVYLDLDTEARDRTVGVCRCGVEDAEANGVCLEISHVSWIELKENEHRVWGEQSPYRNKRYFDTDPRMPDAVATRELEETLPVAAPHRDEPDLNEDRKYAIYSLVSLDSAGLEQLERDVNTLKDGTGNSILAPQADFSGRSLRDIYDYHIRIRDKDARIHPLYFIVADQSDWTTNGVLIIYLSVGKDRSELDRPEYVVGVSRCGINEADSYGANLDVGNLDWMDIKEAEEHSWNGDDPYANKRYYPRDPREPTTPVEGR